MAISTRQALALGFGLLGVAALVAPIRGQQPPKAAEKPTLPAAVVGAVDMEAVLKSYDKMKFLNEQFKTEAMARQKQLEGLMAKGQGLAKEMQELGVGTAEYKAHDAEITKISGELEIAKQQAKREFAMKESEAMATIYKEAQQVVDSVAKYNNMTFVVRVSRETVNGNDPDSVMAAMSRSVVYFDKGTDMTDTVIKLLNQKYAAFTGGVRPASATSTAPAPAVRPTPGSPEAKTATGPATKGTR